MPIEVDARVLMARIEDSMSQLRAMYCEVVRWNQSERDTAAWEEFAAAQSSYRVVPPVDRSPFWIGVERAYWVFCRFPRPVQALREADWPCTGRYHKCVGWYTGWLIKREANGEWWYQFPEDLRPFWDPASPLYSPSKFPGFPGPPT
jgi:hypothetical protein